MGPYITDLKMVASVADILERELQPTIKDWLRRVNLVPALTKVPLSDADRTGHLPKLYFDLICRPALLRMPLRPFPQPLPRTEKYEIRRAILPACSLMSRGCSRSPPSAHYISIRANSIRARCS
jgi:hypothetical protein